MERKIKPWVLYASMKKETVACGLCGSQKLRQVLNRDRYDMDLATALCKTCGFLFTNPRPIQEEMNRFYQHTYREFYTGTTDPNKEYQEELHVTKRKWLFDLVKPEIEKRNGSSPAVLEVGCGAGVLLHIFRQQIPESRLWGVEPFNVFARHAQEKSQATVVESDIDSFLAGRQELRGTLDLVIFNHVLEHLYQPVEKLLRLREFLSEGGLLLIQVPNLLSPHWQKPLPIFHIAHINHFTPLTMRYALELAGFSVLKEFPLTLPVHPKAMTFLCRKNARIPSRGEIQPPSGEALESAIGQIMAITEKAQKTEVRGQLARLLHCLKDRGPAYTIGRLAHFSGHFSKRVMTLLNVRRWNRYDSLAGVYHHWKNEAALRRLIEGQKVLILGSGPSSLELETVPDDVKILTCNAGLRLFDGKKLGRPADLFLCRKKAMLQDYPDTPELLSRIKTDALIVNETGFVKESRELRQSYRTLLVDHQKDNTYLKKLIRPLTVDQIASDEVVWASAGIRLLQYALAFGAKEIYLLGIDLGQGSYFWGEGFTHKHPIDFNFLQIVSKKYRHVYSLSPSSRATEYFPHKAFHAGMAVC